jgi:hypothetical protein
LPLLNGEEKAALWRKRYGKRTQRSLFPLFERSIDIETYDRHAEKLRDEEWLSRIEAVRRAATA